MKSTRHLNHERFARRISPPTCIRWDIDDDVIRARRFDPKEKFLSDGLALAKSFSFLSTDEKLYLSQVQGRTYANMLELFGRFTGEEIKHQELFRRIEALTAEAMPPDYGFVLDASAVTEKMGGKSAWAVLAFTLQTELCTLAHYEESIDSDIDTAVSLLYRDVFLYHWNEERRRAIVDELELRQIDAGLPPRARDEAVDEFLELVEAADEILRVQAAADAAYFSRTCGRVLTTNENRALSERLLEAYRWQHMLSGAQLPQFGDILFALLDDAQAARVQAALTTLAPVAA